MRTSRFPVQVHGLHWTTHRSRAGALLARRQQHPLPRSVMLLQLQVLLLLRPLRPTAAGQAVEKRLTNERCAVPRHAVSRRGGQRQAQPRARRETEKKKK